MTLQQLRNWHANNSATYRTQAMGMQDLADHHLTGQYTREKYQRDANRLLDLARHHEDAVKLLDSVQSLG